MPALNIMEWNPERNQAVVKLLLDKEDLRRRLFEIATHSRLADSQRESWIRAFTQLVEEASQSVDVRDRFLAIVPELRKGSRLTADELAYLSGLFEESYRMLENHFRSEVTSTKSVAPAARELTRNLERLLDSDLARASGFGTKNKLEILEDYVRSNPGLFIHAVSRRLNSPVRRAGFSYSNVWNLVQHLTNEKRLLTVGGPRGHNRYCFPHPDTIADRTRYYGWPYAIDSVLSRKWTDCFEFARIRKFVDVFEGNTVARHPVLIVADLGRLGPLSGKLVRSFGTLEPFEHLTEVLGMVAHKSVPRKDVLLVGGVSRLDRHGKETPFWVSDAVQESLRTTPYQLVGPRSS